MPLFTRVAYQRELVAWSLLPIMMGAVEGAVTGVIIKEIYQGVVSDRMLNFAVALLTGAMAYANITSFLWAAVIHGRHKIRCLVTVQILIVGLVVMMAFAPQNAVGLVMLIVGAVGARVCWSAVVILRTTIWRANYPRDARATLAGNLSTLQSLMLAAAGLVVGLAIDWDPGAFRYVYPAAAVLGLAGTMSFLRVPVRRHRALLRAERESEHSSKINPLAMIDVLAGDRRFRHYMLCMFLFGLGNLMVTAPVVIMLKDRFHLSSFNAVLIASSIPLLMMPLTVPVWSRVLNRMPIVRFRAIHSWSFVTAILLFLIGALTGAAWLMVLGACMKGVAIAGGVLGWNLGHHDFAPADRSAQYMAVHVTLTGIRGVIAPFLALGLYEWFEALAEGSGAWCLAVAFSLSVCGAIGFVVTRKSLDTPHHDDAETTQFTVEN